MTSINAHYIKEQILKSTYPVALTGAGISVASSLPTLTKDYRDIPIKKSWKDPFLRKILILFMIFIAKFSAGKIVARMQPIIHFLNIMFQSLLKT